ncbi:MAG: AAA family ATPase [Chitinophagaceae bacterium]
MDNIVEQRIINADGVFNRHFIDSKALYMYNFGNVPCISFIRLIDGEKAFNLVQEKFGHLTKSVHCYRCYEGKKKADFEDTLVVLNNRCVLEFNFSYCEILYDFTEEQFVSELVDLLKVTKRRQKRKPLEINLVVQNNGYIDLKPMEIKRTGLDVDLFFEDDFKPVDETIRKRLNKKKDKGIVLLHGLPGTGKTTYLRYLAGKIQKKVLFVSPEIGGNLVNPEFIDLLIDNPDSVVIVEDAERIIMDRRTNPGSSVTNLLNISDGLLADFLNVQLICTFNNSLTSVDQALLRKGRLIARYEFGKLSIEKARRLSQHFGFEQTIEQPMTIAEIANPHEKPYRPQQVEVIGFRQGFMQN